MTLEELLRQGKSFGQGASNGVASTLTGPVDTLAWLLRKGGLPVGDAPIGGEQWMRNQGLMATPENKLAGLLGEGLGMAAPIVGSAKAAEIAGGLLQMGRNLATPQTMNKQAGMALFDTTGLPNRGREVIQSKANELSDKLKSLGMDVKLEHSGSAAGPSSYLKVYDPETGRFFVNDVRLSGHPKGVFNSQGVWDVNESEFQNVVDAAQKMRDMGPSKMHLMQAEKAAKAKK